MERSVMIGIGRRPVYIDYAAATPVDTRVIEKIISFFAVEFWSAASRRHAYGWTAETAVEDARQSVASLLNCDPIEIVWNSGATKANNLTIKSVTESRERRGKHIITASIEHLAVLDTCRYIERRGFNVTYLCPQESEAITLEQVRRAIHPDNILVSFILVNNEIGIAQVVAGVGALCGEREILFHGAAAQAAGKVLTDLQSW
jgi:cysteine desulfurase